VRASVISLTERGPVGEEIEAAGIPVASLDMGGPLGVPSALIRLVSVIRREHPDIVQTWMYNADLLGGVAARMARVKAIAWGVRLSGLELVGERRWTRFAVRAAARLSHVVPEAIVYNAESGRRAHEHVGYARDRGVVIPNGFDIPPPPAAAGLRESLGISQDARIVGRVARYHPVKDYGTFLRAAGEIARQMPDVHFLACGDGITEDNVGLQRLVSESDPALRERFHPVGPLADVGPFYAAIDVACSASIGEGFPNVVGEAMAAGVPGVVTDVGDSALLLGEAGLVVRPGDPDALASALAELLAMPHTARQELGKKGRERIEVEFTLPKMAKRYVALYRQLAGR
jgi:glycosyltransferase involved in cell wall biosynthesis